MIYANLLHLSYNMWCDWDNPAVKGPYYAAKPYLRFDDNVWNDLLAAMVKAKMNMVVIDLGDGVKYQSHPEIAVEGAQALRHNGYKIPLMRNLVKRAIRGSGSGA